jgi:hypothetical protein
VLFSFDEFFDYFLVLLLVALLEADLRVADDAPGVNDVGRSAESIALSHIRLGPEKDRVGEVHFLVGEARLETSLAVKSRSVECGTGGLRHVKSQGHSRHGLILFRPYWLKQQGGNQ